MCGSSTLIQCDAEDERYSTGLPESCSSLTHRFSRGIIPIGSLSCRARERGCLTLPFHIIIMTLCSSTKAQTYCCVFKVVQAAVSQNEPPSLPRFNPTSCNDERKISETRAERRSEVPWSSQHLLCAVSSFISPILRSQPSRSGLKNVSVRSFPSSSGILNGSLRMLAYSFWKSIENVQKHQAES